MKTDIQIAQETKMELIKNVAARLDIQELSLIHISEPTRPY